MIFLVEMNFGSHVYGTNIPSSDRDFKCIHVPSQREILLQNTVDYVKLEGGKEGVRNDNTVTDRSSTSVQRYINELIDGNTVAIDMLFVPHGHIIKKTIYWDVVRRNKDKILTNQVQNYIRYSRSQTDRYGIKGSRFHAVNAAIEYFRDVEKSKWLEECELQKLVDECPENISLIEDKNGKTLLNIADKKFNIGITVSNILTNLENMQSIYEKHRKEINGGAGIDWKPIMHAIRILQQGKELLITGNIEFPRPNAEELVKIRLGKYKFEDCVEIIELGHAELKNLKSNVFNSSSDLDWCNELISDIHYDMVVRRKIDTISRFG